MFRLLYHGLAGTAGVESPFDAAILRVAQHGPLRIVSPYIGVNYIRRFTETADSWRLISDVEEWLGSLSITARGGAWQFIRDHSGNIRHCRGVHAKVVIGSSTAMFGSANLTEKGVLGRTELGAFVDCDVDVCELQSWFEDLWSASAPLVLSEADALVQWLDAQASLTPSRRCKSSLSSTGKAIRASLAHAALSDTDSDDTANEPIGLNLRVIAKRALSDYSAHFDTLGAAFGAASAALALRKSFEFRDLVSETQSGFPNAGVREIYLLTLQHVANHHATVFLPDTLSHFIRADGKLVSASPTLVFQSLAPFDRLLESILRLCAEVKAQPIESLARAVKLTGTRFSETQLVSIFEQLQLAGLFDIEDRPGASPRFGVRADFEWDGRYRAFPLSRSAFNKLDFSDAYKSFASPVDEDSLFDDATSWKNGALDDDALPPRDDDTDDLDLAQIESEVLVDVARQRFADARAVELVEKVDAVLLAVLSRLIGVGPLHGGTLMDVARTFSESTGVGRYLVEAVLKGDKRFPRIVKLSGAKGARTVQINERIEWADLASYPRTLEFCKQLFQDATRTR